MLGNKNSIAYESWPKYDENLLKDDNCTLAVQVNGKVRATITVNVDSSEEEIKKVALEEENVKKHIADKEIVKFIVIKNKIVNIVVK